MTTLTLTIRQAAEAHAALEQWSNVKLPAQAAYWLARIKREVSPAVEPFIETRNSKAVEYGIVKDGVIDSKAPNFARFSAEINALLEEQIEVDVKVARLDTFARTKVQPGLLVPLLPFFEDNSRWDSVETPIPMDELLELDSRLAQAQGDPLPFLGAYLLARLIDSITPAVTDFAKWRAATASEMGVLTAAGLVDLSHPHIDPYRKAIEDRVESSGNVNVRHPHVPFTVLDGDNVEIAPALLSAMWFVWKDEDDDES